MSAIRFNAITYSHKLQEAGLDQKIADVQAEELSILVNNDLATKSDLTVLEKSIQKDLKNLENRMTIKLGGIVISCTGIISILIGILGFILKH